MNKYILICNMKSKGLGLIAFFAGFSTLIKAQEISNSKELMKYELERLPSDVLDIYNNENYGGVGFIPYREMQNLEKLELHSDYKSPVKNTSRFANYNHTAKSLTIGFQGLKMGQKMEYSLKDSQLTKIMYSSRDGKEEMIQKVIKTADKNGRIIRTEYFHPDSSGKWIFDYSEKKQIISYRGELILEIRKSPYGTEDTTVYRYQDGYLSTKKAGNSSYVFNYYKSGQIALIEQKVRGFKAADSVKYFNINYEYNEQGFPIRKFSDDDYFNTKFSFQYDKKNKLVSRTKLIKGDNEIKEITAFTYDEAGKLNGINQTVNLVKTLKLNVTCDAQGNISTISGNQFKVSNKVDFKNKKGSMGSEVDGPGNVDFKLTLQPR